VGASSERACELRASHSSCVPLKSCSCADDTTIFFLATVQHVCVCEYNETYHPWTTMDARTCMHAKLCSPGSRVIQVTTVSAGSIIGGIIRPTASIGANINDFLFRNV
jgi:hypothetical protein